jgi:hypothetical protein
LLLGDDNHLARSIAGESRWSFVGCERRQVHVFFSSIGCHDGKRPIWAEVGEVENR